MYYFSSGAGSGSVNFVDFFTFSSFFFFDKALIGKTLHSAEFLLLLQRDI